MAQSPNTAADRIQDIARSLDGMRSAPAELLPESAPVFPFATTHVAKLISSVMSTRLMVTSLYEIHTTVHVARKDLARDYAKVNPFVESLPEAIWTAVCDSSSPNLNGAVQSVNSIASDELGASAYGDIDTLGWLFRIEVKVLPFASGS